jgi:hypothetical protein
LISAPVEVDSSLTNNFVDLIYSDSSSFDRTMCYEPRHGIILWGTSGKYLGFVEICFECNGVRTTSGIPKPQNLPGYIFDELELLFKSFGLIDEPQEEND